MKQIKSIYSRSKQMVGFMGLICAMMLTGCESTQRDNATLMFYLGDYGRAREALAERVANQARPVDGDAKKIDRTYLLNRMRLMIANLASGYANPNDRVVEEVYEVLRTQGVNEDKTVESVVLNEDLKTWKGEPFEQAMAFCYIGIHYAMNGDWGNMRAASDNALFYLRDFGGRDVESVVKEAAKRDQINQGTGDAVIDNYKVIESNFKYGYLLHAIANQQMNQQQEAIEAFDKVIALDPQLRSYVDVFKKGDYNVVLVLDYGRGPAKRQSGPDGAVAKFVPMMQESGQGLSVVVNGQQRGVYPKIVNLNNMATDMMWNNLQDVRLAKSAVGDALLLAGAFTASQGRSRDSSIAALALLGGGLIAKAGAHADTRHCELLPQRTYVLPLKITEEDKEVVVYFEGESSRKIVLRGIKPPKTGQPAALRYVRMTGTGGWPDWAENQRIFYSNEYAPDAATRNFPYVLGGDDVRTPSESVLTSYQKSGYLQGMMMQELVEVYRAEGIFIHDRPGDVPGRHILEGGKWMVNPIPGTGGYMRLFGRRWADYIPESEYVKQIKQKYGLAPTNAQNAQTRPDRKDY